MDRWIRTDELEEAISGLETAAIFIPKVQTDLYAWKWVILAVHTALQGFMVSVLLGSNGLLPLRDDISRKWMEAYSEGNDLPREQLDTFLGLYKKIKSSRLCFYLHSKPFEATDSQDHSVRKLHELRNKFIHFLPRNWSLEVSGLPVICLDSVDVATFLAWECGNIYWSKLKAKQRAQNAFSRVCIELTALVDEYEKA